MRQFQSTSAELIRDEMQAHFGPHVSIKKISGYLGRSEIFTVNDVEAIIKVFHLQKHIKRDREQSALQLLQASPLLVPHVLCSGEFSDGEYWLLMTYIAGETMETVLPDINAQARQDLFGDLGTLLAQLHSFDIDPDDKSLHQECVTKRYQSFRDKALAASRPEHHMLVEAAEKMRLIEDNLQPNTAKRLVHRDFSSRNILVQKSAVQIVKIVGLIDFERAQIGDPIEDLAMLTFKEFMSPSSFQEAFLAAYRLLVPFHEEDADRLRYHLYALMFEIVNWAFEDDPAYYRRAVETIELLNQNVRLAV